MVRIVHDRDKKRALIKAVEGLQVEKGKRVAIKPNLGISKKEACTDLELLQYLVEYIKEFLPEKVYIVESDTYTRSIQSVYEEFDFASLDVVLVNVSEGPFMTIWPDTSFFKAFSYPVLFREIDYVISFAKLKTHILTTYTGVLKNQYGLLPFPDKRIFHRKVDQVIVDLNVIFPCQFYLLDGFFAMQGEGPLDGDVVELDLLFSGNDPVAVDHCACTAVGIPVDDVAHLVLSERSGLGRFEYELEGEIPKVGKLNLPKKNCRS